MLELKYNFLTEAKSKVEDDRVKALSFLINPKHLKKVEDVSGSTFYTYKPKAESTINKKEWDRLAQIDGFTSIMIELDGSLTLIFKKRNK